MKTNRLFSSVLFVALCLFSIQATAKESPSTAPSSYRPKLVVGIVIDQMRWDYLERYREYYEDGGFMRMMKNGYSCDNCMIPYLPTVTAVGHASIFTGTYPALSGIVNNNYMLNGKMTYAVWDDDVNSVGTESTAGKKSPKNLLPTTITDELRMATNFTSKVIGVSLKDRAAILPAGHTANAAYWLESGSKPQFITSDYYMKTLPQWVNEFNNKHLAEKYMKKGWQWMYPNNFYDKQSHPLDSRIELPCSEIAATPYGTTMTLLFAEEAIKNEKLGVDNVTDFLTINIASTDYVGHRTGVNSRYTMDVYMQLDRDLGRFLRYLDEKIGEGEYLIFLTADHAGSHNLQYRIDHHLPAEVWENPNKKAELDSMLTTKLGLAESPILAISTYQIYYDTNKLKTCGVEEKQITETLLDYLRHHPSVAYAFSFQDIPDYVPEPIRSMAIRGYNPKRSGVIQIIPESGVTEAYRNGADHYKGTSHALWGPDDAHIPLLFYGWKIPHGRSSVPCEIVDIAPTVAALLHIQMPSANVGKPIQMR